MRIKDIFMGMTIFISTIYALPLHAEETQRLAENVYKLPAITVTADKRPTELQKTPVAITVLTSDDLEDKNITTLKEALNYVPNLSQSSYASGQTVMSFRGANTSVLTDTSPLVIYVDGVPISSFAFVDANLINVERIEFLRGAQGVMYGKNAFAGVINIISKKPDNDFTGKVFTDVSSLGSLAVGANISGPIVEDRFYFSLGVSHDYSAGYMKNHPNSENNNNISAQMVKGQLRFTPSDSVEINLYADYMTKRDGILPAVTFNEWSDTTPAYNTDERDYDMLNLALHGEFSFSDMLLTSITTYRYDYYDGAIDVEPYVLGGYYSTYKDTNNEFTQEFRLQNEDGQKGDFNWMVGVFGGYREFDRPEYSGAAAKGDPFITNFPFKENSKEIAPFAQVEIPIMDKLRLTAGLRYQYTEKEADLEFLFNGATQSSGSAKKSWAALLPRLTLSYDITDEHMIYAGVGRSFLPGGFNAYSGNYNDSDNYIFEPQYSWNYEIGAKTSWLDQRLMANVTLFYSQYEDLQVFSFDPAGGSTAVIASNAGKATAYGAEFELTARILPELTAQAVMGYTHAKYDDYTATAFGGATNDFSGKRVELSPEFTGNFSLLYRHESGFMASAGANYTSQIYWDAANTESRGDIITVDAKVGYETDSFDVYAYGTNIFNEKYLTFYTPYAGFGTGDGLGFVGAPQEFGVRMVYKF